jgi:hypothetical protein
LEGADSFRLANNSEVDGRKGVYQVSVDSELQSALLCFGIGSSGQCFRGFGSSHFQRSVFPLVAG